MAASRAGVDAVDAASAPMAGTTSQPPLSALVAALAHTERDTGLDLQAVSALEPYWEAVRRVYAPFESGLPGPTGRVYHHEIPGGQLSNLRQQAIALGLADRFEEIEDWYARANTMLGRPPKVTPSSKVVGDLALHLVAMDVDPDEFEANPGAFDVPDSVVGFMAGELGDLPGGWPEPFRTKILKGKNYVVREEVLSPDHLKRLALPGLGRQALLNELLFPGPTKEFEAVRENYGDVSVLATKDYLYGLRMGEETVVEVEPGVSLYVSLDTVSEPDDHGIRTVMVALNGQVRPVSIKDHSIKVTVTTAEKADPGNPQHVAAPFSGVVTLSAKEGDTVAEGDIVATIEAMKMEAGISASANGIVERVAIPVTQQVEAGDLLLVIS
jgi:pyruvate carboxylase